jgi:hypothetical protein
VEKKISFNLPLSSTVLKFETTPFKYKGCLWTVLITISKENGIGAFLGFNDSWSLPNE